MHSCFRCIKGSDVVTSAFIVRVKGEQAVKAILLLAPGCTQMTFGVLGTFGEGQANTGSRDGDEYKDTQKDVQFCFNEDFFHLALALYLQPGRQRPSDISAWQVSMWMYCSNG